MKLNSKCARAVLLETEKIPFGETITVAKLHENISEYSIEDVLHIVTLFNREHYLSVIDKASYDDNEVFRDHKVKGLTERGYRVLDMIRDEELWNEIYSKVPNAEELSFYTILDIASRINCVKQNELFGLPKEFPLQQIKW